MIPVINPIANAPPELYIIPAAAPMTTPPDKVAFNKCYIVNLSFKNALVINVARQLPVNERIVFEII